MNTQPTPAPWFAELNTVTARTSEHGELIRPSCVAVCYAEEDPANDYKNSEALANARLLAAAPDLLKCCEYMLEWEKKGFDAPMSVSQILARMKVAIAKATQTTHAGETATQV